MFATFTATSLAMAPNKFVYVVFYSYAETHMKKTIRWSKMHVQIITRDQKIFIIHTIKKIRIVTYSDTVKRE